MAERPEAQPLEGTLGRIPITRQRGTALAPRRRYTQRVRQVVVRHLAPHPVSVAMATAIGDMWGRGIAGYAGTVSTGASRNGAGAVGDPTVGFAGYGAPPQVFSGWHPGYQAQVGTTLKDPTGLPNTSAGTASPLDSAMVQIMAGSS